MARVIAHVMLAQVMLAQVMLVQETLAQDMLAQVMLAQVMLAQVMLVQDMLWPALSGLDQLVLICFPNQPAQRPFVATTSFQEAPWDHVAFKRLSSRSDDDTVRGRRGWAEKRVIYGPRGGALSHQ